MEYYTLEELTGKRDANYKNECNLCGIPKKKSDVKLDAENREIFNAIITDIVTLIKEDTNFVFWSRMPGTGKTVTASNIGIAYIRFRVDMELALSQKRDFYMNQSNLVQFVNVNELLFLRKDFNNQESQEQVRIIENRIKNCDIVIWDDIGLGELSTYDKEYLTMLIDKRLNQYHKINIYTTNCDKEQLYKAVGRRLFTRIFENSKTIEFEGGNKR